ncbi:MAG TPA: VWA domain-containing protein [Bryobacteraceae bacterium]|nr:VWA domain-containing protein [Bryobacteraceae bacterium]
MMKRILEGAWLLCFLASPTFAQSQQPPASAPQTPTIKTTVDEVLLDMVVRDKKGKPITDLGPDDLSVIDNGAKQKIVSFRLVQGAETIGQQGAHTTLDPLRQLRLVTLAFEGMEVDQRAVARRAAIDLIKGEQGANVYYSVVAIASQLQVLQPFTNDKELLRKAIERATSGLSSTQLTQDTARIKNDLHKTLLQATGTPDQRAALEALNAPSLSTGNGPPSNAAGLGSSALNAKLVQVMLDMLRYDATVTNDGSRLTIFSLESLVNGLAKLPGRKSVLYFSWGMYIPTYLDEAYRNLISMANRSNVTFYTVDTRGVMTWSQNTGSTDQLTRATQGSAANMNKGAVSWDQIMAADNAETSMRNDVQGPMRDLSQSTGGFLIGDSNDLRVPLRHVNEEINSYYEISYNPGIQNYDGTFRKVRVETGRKDLVLHARSGYFALPPEVRSEGLMPFEVPLLKALSDATLPHDVAFRSSLLRFQNTADGIRTSVVVEVPVGNLTFLEDKEKNQFNARLSLVALVKDDKGQVVQKFERDMPLQGTLDKVPGVKMGNFIYKELFTAPPGKYTLEAAVVDRENNKIGANRSAFELAAPRGVGISGISLVRSYQPNVKDLDANDPFQFQGGRVTPTLSPTIKAEPGAMLNLFFVVYPDPGVKAKPSLAIEYLREGQVVGQGNVDLPAPDAQGRIPYIMGSQASGMPPGEYVVHATVKQGDSAAEARTTVKVE